MVVFFFLYALSILHSARARAITDRVNGEGLGSEARLLYRPYSRAPAQSVFFRVHPLSVRELTFTCMRGKCYF